MGIREFSLPWRRNANNMDRDDDNMRKITLTIYVEEYASEFILDKVREFADREDIRKSAAVHTRELRWGMTDEVPED
jgi:hypothetical protein